MGRPGQRWCNRHVIFDDQQLTTVDKYPGRKYTVPLRPAWLAWLTILPTADNTLHMLDATSVGLEQPIYSRSQTREISLCYHVFFYRLSNHVARISVCKYAETRGILELYCSHSTFCSAGKGSIGPRGQASLVVGSLAFHYCGLDELPVSAYELIVWSTVLFLKKRCIFL